MANQTANIADNKIDFLLPSLNDNNSDWAVKFMELANIKYLHLTLHKLFMMM